MQRYRSDYVRRSSRRRRGTGKNVFGTIAMILALVLIFVAGAIVGRIHANRSLNEDPNTAQSGISDVSSGTTGNPQGNHNTMPEGVETAARDDGEQVGGSGSILPIDEIPCNYLVLDRTTGEVILQKGADSRIYPASTTKVMTAALSLELEADLNKQMTAQPLALSLLTYDAATVGLLSGETISFQDLLYGMMLPSGCDAANVIAQNAAPDGNYNTFVSLMNQKATAIGCSNTYFVNPSGLHSSSHFSTVSDLARIEAYAQHSPLYRQIVGTKEYAMNATNLHQAAGWNIVSNSNQLLDNESLFPSGKIIAVNGSKTGSTVDGGYSLICTAVTADGVELIAVISGIPYENGKGIYNRTPYMCAVLEEAARLIDEKEKTTVVPSNAPLGSILPENITQMLPENTVVIASRGFSYLKATEQALQNGDTPVFVEDLDFQTTVTLYDDFLETVAQFDPGEEKVIGYLTVSNQSETLALEPIPLILKAAL